MFLASSLGTGQRECHHHTATLGGKGSGSVCVPVITHTMYRSYSWATSCPMSITTNEPRKLCHSQAEPHGWGRQCPSQRRGCPRVPLGAPGCRGAHGSTPPPAVPIKGNSEER